MISCPGSKNTYNMVLLKTSIYFAQNRPLPPKRKQCPRSELCYGLNKNSPGWDACVLPLYIYKV